MTQTRDVERVLDRWLADGPAELPDRALERALVQIEHTHQRGAHVVPRRFNDMPTSVRLLLVAALMAASAGAAILLSGGMRRDAPPPSPPTPIKLGAGTPIGLDPAGAWTAERPAVFGQRAGEFYLFVPANDAYLVAGYPGGPDVLLGSITSAGPNRTELGPTAACPKPGTYTWEVSEDTWTFTIKVEADDCADRAMLLAGPGRPADGQWVRTGIDHEIAVGQRYRVAMRGVTVDLTVPSSFVSSTGGRTDIHGTANPSWAVDFETTDLSLDLLTDPGGIAAIDRCHLVDERRALPTTIDDYLAWTRASQGVEVSAPVSTMVAGLPAVSVDLVGGASCQASPDGMTQTFIVAGLHGREWAIDLGDRLLLAWLVDDNAPFDPLTPAMLATGQAFIDSMEIQPTP